MRKSPQGGDLMPFGYDPAARLVMCSGIFLGGCLVNWQFVLVHPCLKYCSNTIAVMSIVKLRCRSA